MSNDVLVVFQYDAVIGVKNAGYLILQHALQPMKEDIMYLGYCFKSYGIPKFLRRKRFIKYHPTVTGLAPHCMHAYAISVQGADKLLQHVKPCAAPVDHQVAELANKGILSFKLINTTYDEEFTKNEFAKYGVHWRDDHYGANRDGIFPQIVLDDNPPAYLPDGTAAHDLGRERSVFIMADQSWRYIPNYELYLKIMMDVQKGEVKVLTSWQFRHWSEGSVLTEADVPRMIALRKALKEVLAADVVLL